MSKHISALEEDLGVPLFYRDKRSVTLTPRGEKFLPDAEKIVEMYNRNKKALRYAFSKDAYPFRIVYLDAAARNFPPTFARTLSSLRPNLEVLFTNASPQKIGELLAEGKCDLAITIHLKAFSGNEYNCFTLYDDPICVLVPRDHKLATQDMVELSDLNGETLITSHEPVFSEYRDYIHKQIEQSGVKVNYFKVTSSAESSLIFIESGQGLALRPSHQCLLLSPGITAVPLCNKNMTYGTDLVWRTNNKHPHLSFIVDLIKEMFK